MRARARLLMKAPVQIQMRTGKGYGRNAAHVTESHLQQAQKAGRAWQAVRDGFIACLLGNGVGGSCLARVSHEVK